MQKNSALRCRRVNSLQAENAVSFMLFRSVADLDEVAWDRLTLGRNVFLSRRFLKALETASIPTVYVLFYSEGRAVGAAAFQSVVFRSGPLAEYFSSKCPVFSLVTGKLRFIRNPLASRLLVCGTPFSAGEHGFVFTDDVPAKHRAVALRQAAEASVGALRTAGVTASSAVLFKEFSPMAAPLASALHNHGYAAIATEPCMVLHVDPSWQNFDGYLESLSSKYRVKAKREHEKSRELLSRDLSADDIQQLESSIDLLYTAVVDRAQTKMGEFHARLLSNLCRELGDCLIVKGYFLKDRLVGFLMGFVNGQSLEAAFVGFDYSINHRHAVYPRILYDYLKEAFKRNLSRVNFGRTAAEIKSTLGAVPVPMTCCLRLERRTLNTVLPILSKSIQPKPSTIRRPFKMEFYGRQLPALVTSNSHASHPVGQGGAR